MYKRVVSENVSMFWKCISGCYQKTYQCLGNEKAGAIRKMINVWGMYKQVLSESVSMFGECLSRCYQKAYQCLGNV